MTNKENNAALKPADLEAIERVIYRNGDDIAVSVARAMERIEEQISAMECRLEQGLGDDLAIISRMLVSLEGTLTARK